MLCPLHHQQHFYPRSPCGERPNSGTFRSTHKNFYPRSPCGERLNAHLYYHSRGLFLSTLSLRRATYQGQAGFAGYRNFYPRSPCGERHRKMLKEMSIYVSFLSTLSLRRATSSKTHDRHKTPISIHALLAESDLTDRSRRAFILYFYPRSPCGERRVHYDNYNLHCVISIHALLAESDSLWALMGGLSCNDFYPRSPCGERLSSCFGKITSVLFLSTLSLRRATLRKVPLLGIK